MILCNRRLRPKGRVDWSLLSPQATETKDGSTKGAHTYVESSNFIYCFRLAEQPMEDGYLERASEGSHAGEQYVEKRY